MKSLETVTEIVKLPNLPTKRGRHLIYQQVELNIISGTTTTIKMCTKSIMTQFVLVSLQLNDHPLTHAPLCPVFVQGTLRWFTRQTPAEEEVPSQVEMQCPSLLSNICRDPSPRSFPRLPRGAPNEEKEWRKKVQQRV